ncbi:MAG: hypothetical protein QM775_02155 [Pirellulales bacterium]
MLAALFRDFEAADRALDAAEAIAPTVLGCSFERSEVLMYEDRHDEALAAAQRSLAMRTWYRPGVQAAAHLLTMRSRDEEALELLRGASEVLESGDILFQLSGMLMERRRYAEAREVIERIPALCPLMEKKYLKALSAQRCDAAYHCGDEAAAIEHARKAGKGFHEKLADRLAAAKPAARRIELDVPFVRQHHVTCARRRSRPSPSIGSAKSNTSKWRKKSATTALRRKASARGPSKTTSWLANSRSIWRRPKRWFRAACRLRLPRSNQRRRTCRRSPVTTPAGKRCCSETRTIARSANSRPTKAWNITHRPARAGWCSCRRRRPGD